MGSHQARGSDRGVAWCSLQGSQESQEASLPAVRRIKVADLRDVLMRGLDDFGVYRTDVIFLCLIYPLVGIALAWLTFGTGHRHQHSPAERPGFLSPLGRVSSAGGKMRRGNPVNYRRWLWLVFSLGLIALGMLRGCRPKDFSG
jgi:hypothetical protein